MATITDGVMTIEGPIKHKRGTSAALAASDYVPAAGEIIVATDTGEMKAGDGVTRWSELPYLAPAMLSNDDKVYVLKNGAYVEATLVAQPSEWSPEIDDTKELVLTVDKDMTPYQLTGNNVEVNA